MDEISQIKRRIENLESFVKSLETGFSLPSKVEAAIRDRLGDDLGGSSTSIIVGAEGTPTDTNIVLAGSPPYTFAVLDSSKTLKLTINGTEYEFLLK